MNSYIITISDSQSATGEPIEHYRRRIEGIDLAAVIQRLDQALNVPVRKPRRDKGVPRKEGSDA